MFASIVSKVSKLVRNAVRTLGAVVRRAPWMAPIAIFAVFFML
jgi:hypothetical protein